jgi:hypothetical protein
VKITIRCGVNDGAKPCGRVLGTVTTEKAWPGALWFNSGTNYDGRIEGRDYQCPKHGRQQLDREDFRQALDAGDRVLLTYRREPRHGV